MIRIEDLEFGYPGAEFCLRVPALAVEQAEAVAIVGPSGSGKTTLLHLVAGITRPSRGSVVADGVDLAGLDEGARRDFRLRRIGLVFQEFELLEHLSVLDNVLLPYRLGGPLRLDGAARERAAELAERVGLGDKLARHPSRLSQGERQRVAVCRALVTRPALLLADEPTGNLDAENSARVLDNLIDFAAEAEATLVVVTHDREMLPRFRRVVDLAQLGGGA